MDAKTDIEGVPADPDVPDLDGVTCYEDGDQLVICDRENPSAWIRSDVTRDQRV